jgi:hypothetical protein
VLYLGIAGATVLVLGPAASDSSAPLADLLAIGVGGPARVLAALAAVLLTLGTMNAYYAGAAKLGAALGRDGALPAWLAVGSQAGEVPRRSLAVVSGSAAVALVAVTAAGVGVRPLVLLTTGCFVLVYALGTAAAIRLLPPGGAARRMAFVAVIAVAALLAATGGYLLWPLVLAAAALGYQRLAGARTGTSSGEVVLQRDEPAVPVAGQRGEELLRHSHGAGLEPVPHPAPLPRLGRHQAGLGQQGQVFGDRLPGDRQAGGQIGGRGGAARRQRGEDAAPARVGQGDEDLLGDRLDVRRH